MFAAVVGRVEAASYETVLFESAEPIAAQLWTVDGMTRLAINTRLASSTERRARIARWAEAHVGAPFAELSEADLLLL